MSNLNSPTVGGSSNSSCVCPVGNSLTQGKQCELLTLSASKASAALVILGAMIVFCYRAYIEFETDYDKIFAVQGGVVLVTTTICYLVGAWEIEERYIIETRKLGTFCSLIEWSLRAIILCFLGVSSVFFGGLFSAFGLSPIGSGLVFLAFCSFLYLLWDSIVTLGGGLSLVWNFHWLDVFGAIATIFCLGSYLTGQIALTAISFVLAIVYAVITVIFFRAPLWSLLVSMMHKNRRR